MTQGINNECWRNISGYLNYQVSNIGRVRNVKTERILKPQILQNGLLYRRALQRYFTDVFVYS